MRLAFAVLLAALSTPAMADEALNLELNTVKSVEGRCQLSYLIENKGDQAIESFKLDLVVLGVDNIMQRRMVIDIAPLRASKTMFRVYEIDPDCDKIGAVLVNDVQACTPGDRPMCLDRLVLSSKVSAIRLFK
ncbi:MAG TPA: hypothetical protein VNR39_09495 [Pseudolabrys sp.]|nr:hypothetical protein [Pseudolabrys sp.]